MTLGHGCPRGRTGRTRPRAARRGGSQGPEGRWGPLPQRAGFSGAQAGGVKGEGPTAGHVLETQCGLDPVSQSRGRHTSPGARPGRCPPSATVSTRDAQRGAWPGPSTRRDAFPRCPPSAARWPRGARRPPPAGGRGVGFQPRGSHRRTWTRWLHWSTGRSCPPEPVRGLARTRGPSGWGEQTGGQKDRGGRGRKKSMLRTIPGTFQTD